MDKKIYNFVKGLFEFTKILTIFFTIFYFYAMNFVLHLAEEAVSNNYMGSLAFLTATMSALSGAAALFFKSVIDKHKEENLNKYKPGVIGKDDMDEGFVIDNIGGNDNDIDSCDNNHVG